MPAISSHQDFHPPSLPAPVCSGPGHCNLCSYPFMDQCHLLLRQISVPVLLLSRGTLMIVPAPALDSHN